MRPSRNRLRKRITLTDGLETKKSGTYVFHGDASGFLDWELRASTDERDKKQLASNIVEGRQEDAQTVAELLGAGELPQPDAFPFTQVRGTIKQFILTFHETEVQELFWEGRRRGCIVSCQPGQNMFAYIDRRAMV